MTSSNSPRCGAWRFPVAGAFAVAALVAGSYAWHVAAEFAAAFSADAASVSAHPRDAMLAPVSVALACFAVMALLPDPEIGLRPTRRSARGRRSDAVAGRLFACALAAALATPLAYPIAEVVLNRIATARRYRACPAPAHNRFGLRQWARTPDACREDLR